jgi:long-chain acyl-CoA synthetase
MEKIWLDQYPQDVPAEIDPDAFGSVVEIFEDAVGRFGDRPAFTNFGTTLSFNELDALSRDFAAYLQNDLGIRRGDRVAIMMPNLLQYMVALFGILRTGAIVVNVNPLYTPRELHHQLCDAGARVIVIFANATPVLGDVLDRTPVEKVIVTQLGDLLAKTMPEVGIDERLGDVIELKSALATGREQAHTPVPLTGEDVIFLQYTGGTTGVSKGATLTHRNLVANLAQFSATLGNGIQEGEEIIVTALPLYHIFALMVNCMAFMMTGARNVLITNPRDMPDFVAELKKWRFTAFTGVNTLYNGLLHTQGFSDCDFSGLKICVGGGSAIQQAVAEKWKRLTGCTVLEGYGLSETSPILTVNPVGATEFSGTIGMPVPSTEISLRDDDGNEVPMGEPGELCARGPQVMAGYWEREDATRDAMTEDGFFRTGDVATVDERGYFRIVDRKKDMILMSGFNVFPTEIEAVLVEHEGVLEAACVGVTDEKSGEAVKAFVVAKPGFDLGEAQLREHCIANLAAYKVPKFIALMDELPKSSVGKILRRELRDK